MTYDECFVGQRVKVSGLHHEPAVRGKTGTIVAKDHTYATVIFDEVIPEIWKTASMKSGYNVSLYFLVGLNETPAKIDKYVATAMFRAVSFGTMKDDDWDFMFHALLPEAISLKFGWKCSMCPCVRRCLAPKCAECWKIALAMEGYPDSLYWEYAEFKKEGCI